MMGKGARGTYKMVVDSCFERGMLIVGVDKQFATPRSLQPPIYIHHLSSALPSFNSEKQTGDSEKSSSGSTTAAGATRLKCARDRRGQKKGREKRLERGLSLGQGNVRNA